MPKELSLASPVVDCKDSKEFDTDKADTSKKDDVNEGRPQAGHTQRTLLAFCILHQTGSRVTGQLADTPTRGLPTRGLDNSRMPSATLCA